VTGQAPRKLTDQGKERKQQLLDQAAALFATRGYANTRIADICDAAGVAKGLFYWYFENKEALFTELVRSKRLELRRAQAAAIDPDADPLTRIRQATQASVRYMAEHQAFFALLEAEQQEFAPLLREGNEVHTVDTARNIAEAQRAGLIPDDHDATLLALGVVGAVAHFCHFHRRGRVDMDVDSLATFVADWVESALVGYVPARRA